MGGLNDSSRVTSNAYVLFLLLNHGSLPSVVWGQDKAKIGRTLTTVSTTGFVYKSYNPSNHATQKQIQEPQSCALPAVVVPS